MKWIKETLVILARKCSPKHAFWLLGSAMLMTFIYFMTDRVLDHNEMAIAMNDKIEIEKPENTLPDYVEYKDRTTFLNKAQETN